MAILAFLIGAPYLGYLLVMAVFISAAVLYIGAHVVYAACLAVWLAVRCLVLSLLIRSVVAVCLVEKQTCCNHR